MGKTKKEKLKFTKREKYLILTIASLLVILTGTGFNMHVIAKNGGMPVKGEFVNVPSGYIEYQDSSEVKLSWATDKIKINNIFGEKNFFCSLGDIVIIIGACGFLSFWIIFCINLNKDRKRRQKDKFT